MRRTRRVLVAGLVATAFALTGCGAGTDAASQKWYQPADGAFVDAGDIAIRGIVVVADDAGAGTVLANFANPTNEAERVTSIVLNGVPAPLASPITIPAEGYASTTPQDMRVMVAGAGAEAGRYSTVDFVFENAEQASVQTVARPSTIEYYAEFAPVFPAVEPPVTP